MLNRIPITPPFSQTYLSGDPLALELRVENIMFAICTYFGRAANLRDRELAASRAIELHESQAQIAEALQGGGVTRCETRCQ